jgi:dipeptidyl aminopeptidase/acylaminoacyl peptidase
MAVFGLATVGALTAAATPAGAVTPGKNGSILFVANEPCDPAQSFCEPGGTYRALSEMQPDGSRINRGPQYFWADSPSQAGNGSRLLVAVSLGDSEMYKVQRSGELGEYVGDGCAMSWSPDNSSFVHTNEGACYETWNLLTLPYPPGGAQYGDVEVAFANSSRTVAAHPADDRDPDWAPKGNWIAFASNRSGTYQIWIVRPDGSGLKQVTTDGWEKSFPAFSPDGSRIVFTRSSGSSSDLWTVKLDGTGLKQVTKTSAFETQATYSPDGSKFVVARQPSRNDSTGSNLFKMRTDGSGVVQLTTVGSSRWAHTDPFWTNVPGR